MFKFKMSEKGKMMAQEPIETVYDDFNQKIIHDERRLMRSRKFAPLFWTQFFAAFNDNFIKTTLTFLITAVVVYNSDQQTIQTQQTLIALASAVFFFPFLALSATGGQLADRFDKAKLTRYLKLLEIGTAAIAAVALYFSSITTMMVALFLFGVGSALFGPVKYAILPEQLPRSTLPRANAWIEAATFIAILLGTIAAGIVFSRHSNNHILPALVILSFSVISWLASCMIPETGAADPHLVVNRNIVRANISLIRELWQDKRLFTVALMVSWFWFISSVLFTVIADLLPILGGYQLGLVFYLVIVAVAVALGSAIAAWLSAGRIVLLQSVVGTAICGLTMFDLSHAIFELPHVTVIENFSTFLATPGVIRIAIDLAVIAITGAFLVVPGFAALQAWAQKERRARVIAANNILNSLFMVIGALIMAGLTKAHIADLGDIVFWLGVLCLIATALMFKFLPTNAFRDFVSILFRAFFRLEVKGMENFKDAGDAPILALNHVSFLDGLLALAICETTSFRNPAFAIHSDVARRWWVRPFLSLINAFPMDPTRPLAARRLIREVQKGYPLVIFPEGRITVTGRLMKVYDGAAMVADKTKAKVVPIKIDGLEKTFFSRLSGVQIRRQLFPKVRVTITEPVELNIDPHLKSRARREVAGNELYSIMSDLVFKTSGKDGTVIEELIKAGHSYGMSRSIIEDPLNGSMRYGTMLTAIRALATKLSPKTEGENIIGLMLPNSTVAAVSFFALQSAGKAPAMLNFSMGFATMEAAVRTTGLKTIVTARAFLRQARLEDIAQKLEKAGTRMLYLEDIKKEISLAGKIIALLCRSQPVKKGVSPFSPAAVLFTSGSEGTPKGVVLSHTNMLANSAQAAARVDFNTSDKVFNVLPMFHSFGLTAATVLPLVYGVPVYFYPSPLHYRVVPEAVYSSNATIIFGTDTFLNGYARNAHPYDLRSIRYCFAGAEPVKAATRELMMNKFGIRIFEGYGVTECSPVIALNTPIYNKPGSVGKVMPSIETRLEKVEGVNEGGRLFVKGPNIMMGYLYVDNPGVIHAPDDGWHDTGDIVTIDENGFVTILGRAKRFAKIGGEMVSLAAVEALAAQCWPDILCAVVSIADARKGEKLALVSEDKIVTRSDFLKFAREKGVAEISIPSIVIHAELPLLATGKINYPALKKLVEETA